MFPELKEWDQLHAGFRNYSPKSNISHGIAHISFLWDHHEDLELLQQWGMEVPSDTYDFARRYGYSEMYKWESPAGAEDPVIIFHAEHPDIAAHNPFARVALSSYVVSVPLILKGPFYGAGNLHQALGVQRVTQTFAYAPPPDWLRPNHPLIPYIIKLPHRGMKFKHPVRFDHEKTSTANP